MVEPDKKPVAKDRENINVKKRNHRGQREGFKGNFTEQHADPRSGLNTERAGMH